MTGTRRRFWTLLASLLVAASVSAAPVGDSPNLNYRDPVHKFSLKIFRDWKPVPVTAAEKVVVAKFYDPGTRSGLQPGLEVLKVNRIGPVTGGDEKSVPEEHKSAYDLTIGRLGGKHPGKEEGKDIKSKDDVEGKIWAVESSGTFRTLVTFTKGTTEYGLWMTCSARQRKKYERSFVAIGRSFKFFDKKAKDVKTLKVLDGVNLDEKRRSEIEKGLVKGWDVIVSKKKNYVVIYNTKGKENNLLAIVIAKRIEAIREQIYEVQFPPSKPVDAVSIVRVCGDPGEYLRYGGRRGTAGYWNNKAEELVFYDASRSRIPDDKTIAVLYHEAFHQYIFYSVGRVSPHSWFNEGHGDYYAGAKWNGGRFRIEPFDWRVPVITRAVRKGSNVSTPGGYVPLAKIVRFSQREYYSNPSICYAEGWSLIYFLREVVPRKKSFRAKWGHILDVYFNTLKEQVVLAEAAESAAEPEESGEEEKDGEKEDKKKGPLEIAVDAAFDGVDIAELEKAWLAATKKL